MDERDAAIKDLRRAPGVGKTIAQDLYDLGYRSVDDLRGQNPQNMYDTHCRHKGTIVDPCLLYTFRCAVYFAETSDPEPEKLKWWHWVDSSL